MRRSIRSWKNLLGKLGLQVTERPRNESRARHQQRQLQVESLESRDLMAVLYWDTNGITPGLGGAGTWDTTTANWTTDATGSSTTQAWNNGAGDEAVFAGTAGTVTLGTNINTNSLAIQTTGYTVTGTNTLTLGGTGEVNVASSVAAALSSVVAGSVEFKKTGTGTLTVTKDNSGLTGGSRIEAGTLQVNHDNALGSGTITLAGGKLQSGNGARTLSNALVAATGTTSELVSPTNSNLTLNGNITGNGTIWKTGAYSVFLGGDNSGFSGTFSHRQSNLYFNTAASTSGAAAWDVTGGNQFGLNFSGNATVQFGSLAGTTGSFDGGGNKTGTKTVEIGALNTSTTFAGVIKDYQTTNGGSTIALVKKGTGTLTLSGNSSFSAGSRPEAGTLQVNHNSALGTGAITLAGGKLQSGNSHRTLSNAIVAATGTTSELVSPTNSNLTLNGNITGDGTIWKTGAYSVFLGGDNSGFSGTFSHRQSNLFLNTTNSGSAAAAWDITGGDMLAANFAGDGTVQLGSLSGTTGRVLSGVLNGNKTFEVGALNQTTTYAGTLQNYISATTATIVNVVKKGTAGLTLSGANTFTGNLTIESGSLTLANNTNNGVSDAGKGTITVGSGATLTVAGTNVFGTGANLPTELFIDAGGTLTSANGFTSSLPHVTLNGGTIASGTPHASLGSWAFMNGIDVTGIANSLITAQNMYLDAAAPINIAAGSTLALGGNFDNTLGRGTSTFDVTGDGRLFRYGELVLNGSFEQSSVTAGTYVLFDSIPGWELIRGDKIEIQDNISGLGGASDGAQHLEIDSTVVSSDVQQTISVAPGSVYTVSFDYRGRPGRTTSDNTMVFELRDANNALIETQTITTSNTSSWTTVTHTFQALTDEVRIIFKENGVPNAYGMFVDNVSCQMSLDDEPGVEVVSVKKIGVAGMEPDLNNLHGLDAGFLVYRETQNDTNGDYGYYYTSAAIRDNYAHPVTVNYRFTLPSGTPATYGVDYDAYYIDTSGNEVALAESGMLTIPAGRQDLHVVIRPLQDISMSEGLENVALVIEKTSASDPSLTIGQDTAETSIIDYVNWFNPIPTPPECPCACSPLNNDAAGNPLSTGSNGCTLAPTTGTMPNIQTKGKIPSLPNWNDVDSIRARLTIGGTTSAYVYYDPATVSPNDEVWFNLFLDASGESSGVKDWTIEVDYLDGSGSSLHADSYEGLTIIDNRQESSFGRNWWRSDLDQLVLDADYATIFHADGKVDTFYINGGNFVRATPSTTDIQLTQAGANYLLTDSSGNLTLFDSSGRLLSRTTATGLTTTYEYVSGHPDLLETVTTPDGDVTTYTYETYAGGTKWRVATMVEHDQTINAVTTTFTYNSSSDNLLAQTTRTTADMIPVVKTETFAYDPTTGFLTESTDTEGNISTITYDFAGRVDSIERACGGTILLDPFRSIGLVDVNVIGDSPTNLATLVKVADPTAVGYSEDERGNPTLSRMDEQGRVVWEQDALGNVTTYAYDQQGNLLSMIAADPDGAGGNEAIETLYTYDAQGNCLSQTERTAIGHVVLSSRAWAYDPVFGAVTRAVDELGRTTYYLIGRSGGDANDDGRVLAETRIVGLDDRSSSESDDVTTTYTYGSVSYGSIVVSGLLTSVTDANGHTTNYEYYDNVSPNSGKLGLLQKITNPDLTFRTFDYDAHGNRTSETDELGRTTTYSYDGENRLTGRTDPDPDGAGPLAAPTWSYEYDGNDNQTKIIDPLGRETIMVYNNRTWLAERIEEGGVTTSFTYNCVGDMLTMTDPLGRVTTYAYDDLNRQISVTLPDPDDAGVLTSPVTSTTYDNLGRTLTRTDANGNVTTYGYDQHGFQTTVTLADPDGAGPLAAPIYTSVYDDAGQLIASIDPLGRTTTYGYDDLGRQISVTMPDPDGAGPLTAPVMTTTYDKVGNVLTRTDALGNVTSYGYDDNDRQVSVTLPDPDGAGPQSAPTLLTVYDDAGQVTSTTDALGRVTTYTYDDLGRRIAVTMPDPDGAGPLAAPVLSTTYDVAGQVLTTTDALGNVTSYEYDDLGRQVKVTQPDPDSAGPLSAPEWVTVYDDASQVTSTTDPLGRTTVYTYDNLGRAIAVTQPDPDGAGPLTSPVTLTTYDANGNVLTTTDALGNVTSYTYDALNRRTHTTQADPDGAGLLTAPVWETVYDIASQVTASIDPLGRTTTYEYDDLGRQTKVTSPDPDGAGPQTAAFTIKTYDAVGNILTTEDALGHTTSYEYDNLYRLIASTNANLEETTFTYDLAGNRLTLTDPNNNTTTWEYDDLNRVVSETNELNKTRTYVYDVGGRLTSKVDRLGREVEYVYDNLNRVVEELWDNVSAYTWTYDAAGQLLTGGNAATREYVYTYDNLGRVTQVDTNEFGSSSVYDLNWTYDANGNVLTRSHAANTTDWTYDALNRASSVISTGSLRQIRSTFVYNNAGQLTNQQNSDAAVGSSFWRVDSNTGYAYDGAGRLASLTHNKPALGGVFASYGYSWDAADRITAVDFLNGVYDNEDVDYGYDDAGQVSSADRAGSGADEVYDYDDNGNRDSVTRDGSTASWGVGTNNQLTSDGTNSYTYDDEGNLTSDGVSTYFWDHRNRLIEVRTGSTGVMYTYDVNNLRVGKILDLDGDWDYADPAELDTQTSYYFDGGRMVREVSADGTVENNYLFGPNAQLIAVEDVANSTIKLAYSDHLGSVRDVFVINAGTLTQTEHNVYDSFGRVVERQQFSGGVWNVVSSESIVNLGYTGEYFDSSTGLQYNWNRWYNANTGRWISEDPIGFKGGTYNLNEYAGNGPTIYTDHNGLAITDWKAEDRKTFESFVSGLNDDSFDKRDIAAKGLLDFLDKKGGSFIDDAGTYYDQNNWDTGNKTMQLHPSFMLFGILKQAVANYHAPFEIKGVHKYDIGCLRKDADALSEPGRNQNVSVSVKALEAKLKEEFTAKYNNTLYKYTSKSASFLAAINAPSISADDLTLSGLPTLFDGMKEYISSIMMNWRPERAKGTYEYKMGVDNDRNFFVEITITTDLEKAFIKKLYYNIE